ncbi:MAG: ORF6N domain-containing protein [Desulfomonilia bacterium]|jgi:hypothetical protein
MAHGVGISSMACLHRLNMQAGAFTFGGKSAEPYPCAGGHLKDAYCLTCKKEEYDSLRSQKATPKPGRGGRRYLPYAFTEHGAIMSATVLNSQRAFEMIVFVVGASIASVKEANVCSQMQSSFQVRMKGSTASFYSRMYGVM